MTEEERNWLNNASIHGGSFVKSFSMTCFTADDKNFKILKPILKQMMIKYPSYSFRGERK